MSNSTLASKIYKAALDCGFETCGIISLDALDGFNELYSERIRNVTSSAVFYKMLGNLRGTKERFPWAKAVVICAYWYGQYRYPEELQGRYAKIFFLSPGKNHTQGFNLARFENWFAEQGIRCEGGEQFSHLSIGPLRYIAVMAGLGIVRKNNFFYRDKDSNYYLVGYVIDRECELIQHTELKPCSDACNLCQQACKSKAMKAPYTMSPLKCISFWTTFGRGIVPPFLKKEMFEEWMLGCDNCQDACPYNRKHNWSEGEDFSDLKEIALSIVPENIPSLSDEFIADEIIAKTLDHIQASEVSTIRRNAKRALQYNKGSRDKF